MHRPVERDEIRDNKRNTTFQTMQAMPCDAQVGMAISYSDAKLMTS